MDFVTSFDEDEPANLVAQLNPDVLVKGQDWDHYVSGGNYVKRRGGKVVTISLTPGYSTTAIVKKLQLIGMKKEGAAHGSNHKRQG